MHTDSSIKSIGEVIYGATVDVPEEAGVYAFWWIGAKEKLMSANRHIVLKGPKGMPVDVEYKDW